VRKISGGNALLHQYSDSLYLLLNSLIPEENWQPWRFEHEVKNCWKDLKVHSLFFFWIGKEAGMRVVEDWYKANYAVFYKRGGRRFLWYYDDSPSLVVSSLLPEIVWTQWQFSKVPRGFWQMRENCWHYFKWLKEKYNVRKEWEWMRSEVLAQIRSTGISKQFEGHPLSFVLSMIGVKWKEREGWIQRSCKMNQLVLKETLKLAFPEVAVIEEFGLEESEVDVWIEDYALGLEYQGAQHFDEFRVFSEAKNVQEKDDWKIVSALQRGFSLFHISFLWEGDFHSIKDQLVSFRPDLELFIRCNQNKNLTVF